MRHLKRFNEGLDDEAGLKDFCETYLVYLMDEGFALIWARIYGDDPSSEKETWLMSIRKPMNQFNFEIFRWGDVKDQIIRFAYLIDKEYELLRFNIVRINLDDRKFRLLLPKELRLPAAGSITPTRDFTLQELEDLDDDFLLTSFSLKIIDKI
jgi:hypothetical protein